jgi:acyl-CoA reductase-like NAD-dependent aldehyde dehydrogenase
VTTTAAAPESRHGSSIDVRNPATGESIATVAVTDPDEVRSAVARARAAQPGWEALGFDGRARLFKRCQKWIVDNSDRIVDTIVSETGKAWEDAFGAEVAYAAPAFGFWADNAERYLADERVRTSSPLVKGRKLVVRYAPVGVVGVIGPWNYPLTNSFGDCIPALAAGNAVVLKPSEVTPLTALLMLEMMRECGLPEDVYQVVQGYGETGGALIDAVDVVMFTGSTATGKKVMARAAETLTPVSLELGGKDPMVVCADADLERAANAAVHYSMQNAGQTCISVERVYVEEPVYKDFVDRVSAKVGELRQNRPAGPGSTDLGAVIHPPQADIVQRHVDDAVARGAKVLVGGHRRDEGDAHWFEPTVLVDVDHTMDCMREETFGPTLPIMKVRDADEAVRLANDTPFGLQASVWTKDVAKGERLARRIDAGGVSVNDAQVSYLALELPMGGWKESGLGSRHGADGIRKYAKRQTVLVTRFAPTKRDMHMLPYSARRSKFLQRLIGFLYGRGKRA